MAHGSVADPYRQAIAFFAALELTCGACDRIESGRFRLPTRHLFGCPLLATSWNVGRRTRDPRPALAGRTGDTVTVTHHQARKVVVWAARALT